MAKRSLKRVQRVNRKDMYLAQVEDINSLTLKQVNEAGRYLGDLAVNRYVNITNKIGSSAATRIVKEDLIDFKAGTLNEGRKQLREIRHFLNLTTSTVRGADKARKEQIKTFRENIKDLNDSGNVSDVDYYDIVNMSDDKLWEVMEEYGKALKGLRSEDKLDYDSNIIYRFILNYRDDADAMDMIKHYIDDKSDNRTLKQIEKDTRVEVKKFTPPSYKRSI